MQSMAHPKNPFLIGEILGFAIMLICRVLCVCDMIRESGQNRTKKIMITHVAYFSQMSTFLDEFWLSFYPIVSVEWWCDDCLLNDLLCVLFKINFDIRFRPKVFILFMYRFFLLTSVFCLLSFLFKPKREFPLKDYYKTHVRVFCDVPSSNNLNNQYESQQEVVHMM